MRFTAQAITTADPAQREMALNLLAWVKDSEFDHPMHLREELARMGADRGWTIAQHNGIINVHAAQGIIVRIKPAE